jgi:hypothetical protein
MKNPILLLITTALALCSAALAQTPPPFTWAQPQAKVLPTGDLKWAPQPFEFVAGETVRYIDYEGGNDANLGSRSAPWKHHPWDKRATGMAAQASGSITYVFKGGVIYRGSLKTSESGQPGNPIRLTRDPSWGDGEAWIVGSQAIEGGWKRASSADVPEGMPEPENIWMIELPDMAEPWCIWLRNGEDITRIHLAREPDWEISNPDFVMSEWLSFDGPSREKKVAEGGAPTGSRENWDEDLKQLSTDPNFFGDSTRIWTMWSGGPFSAMGTPFMGKIVKYDPESATIERTTMGIAYFGLAGHDDSYYLEHHPAFLDQPGEFYFEAAGRIGGTLFIRLPADANPNNAVIEVGDENHKKLIDLMDMHHLEISGLKFSFLNVADNIGTFNHTFKLPTAIQMVGDCRHVTISNNRFIHCAKAVQALTRQPGTPDGAGYGGLQGFETIDHLLISDNKIVDALLVTNDWGALQANTGGPIYLYNNHVGNPVGPHPHKRNIEKNSYAFKHYAHNGYGIYLDGSSHKKYVFNNIVWGKANQPDEWFRNRAPQMMVLAGLCNWFNNSFDTFLKGAVGSMGSRSSSMGNIYANIPYGYLGLGMSNDISTAYGGEDPQATLRLGLPTIAYANNVFQGAPKNFQYAFALGVKGGGNIGISTGSIEEFQSFLKDNGALAFQTGWEVEKSPFQSASAKDFRPEPEILAGTKAVKFFVPFSLISTVAEWGFHLNHNDPETVVGENFNMTDEYFKRGQYYDVPWNNLRVPGATEADFQQGTLENYAPSSLVFDGQTRYAVYPHDTLSANFPLSVGIYRDEEQRVKTVDLKLSGKKRERALAKDPKLTEKIARAKKVYSGEDRETVDMNTNNFPDSQTTIEELYAWQFLDGPFLKDFLGQPRDWKSTFPGAIGQ